MCLFSRSVTFDSVTPRTAARQASLSFTISQSLLRLTSVESVMPSHHLILCHPFFSIPCLHAWRLHWQAHRMAPSASFLPLSGRGSEESWVQKNWCFWTVVLEETLESPLDCKEIQPVHSKGDQSWVFFGRNDAKAETLVLWPPYAKSWLIGKDPEAGRDWGQEEKETTDDEMVGWHHRLDGREFAWTPGVGDEQGGLVCCDSWGHKESDMTERLNWTEWAWQWPHPTPRHCGPGPDKPSSLNQHNQEGPLLHQASFSSLPSCKSG